MHKFIVMGAFFLLQSTLSAGSLRMTAMAGRVGPVNPSIDDKNTFGFGLNAYLQSAAKFICSPYCDYWATNTELDNGQEQDWRLFAAGVSALWPFSLHNSKAVPYAGAGAGVHVNDRIKTEEGSSSSAHDRELDFALTAIAGLQLPIRSQLNGFVEFKYAIAGISNYYGFYCGLMLKLRP